MRENNKLIAEFMGLDTEVFKSGKVNYYYYDKVSKQEIFLEAHELSYNVSWDWLMPVIEKITELCEEPQELDELKHALLCVDIKSVYFIIVEFIKDYNQND